MRSVSRFESNLLRILHSFLEQSDVSHVMPAIRDCRQRPSCLSRDAVELVKQSLAVGSVTLLAREGGWARQRHLVDGQIREGSLWQRTDPRHLGFDFSAATLELLIWITAAEAKKEMPLWVSPGSPSPTIGDQFLVSLAARSLRKTGLLRNWYQHDVFQKNALIALLLPEQFAIAGSVPTPDFTPWMTGIGSCLLEALQDRLTEQWITWERDKKSITDFTTMLRFGQVQQTVLDALFDAAETAGRRDLCRFLIDAAAQSLDDRSRAVDWVGSLDLRGRRLADRAAVFQAASVVVRATERLRRWHTTSQGVGYFDEGYGESQWLKSVWESNEMDAVVGHAERVRGELEF